MWRLAMLALAAFTLGTAAAEPRPSWVAGLEAVYGPPSAAGFGSAVFYATGSGADGLEAAAQARYREFVGPLWERWGEEAWMGPWREVYRRPPGATQGVVAELGALQGPELASSAEMLLGATGDAGRALAAAFDDPSVGELAVFALGDGSAMSGLLLAARRPATSESVFLVFLMD